MKISEFLRKLLLMLQDENGSIKWNDSGTQISIKDLEKFKENQLSKFFKHKKIESFIRQLNMYGFRKISRQKNSICYRHKYFIKDKSQSLKYIKRKNKEEQWKQNCEQQQKNVNNLIDYEQMKLLQKKQKVQVNLLLKSMINFRQINNMLTCEIKQQTDELNRCLYRKGKSKCNKNKYKNNKYRLVHNYIQSIKQNIHYMNEKYQNLNFILKQKRQNSNQQNKNQQVNESAGNHQQKIIQNPSIVNYNPSGKNFQQKINYNGISKSYEERILFDKKHNKLYVIQGKEIEQDQKSDCELSQQKSEEEYMDHNFDYELNDLRGKENGQLEKDEQIIEMKFIGDNESLHQVEQSLNSIAKFIV